MYLTQIARSLAQYDAARIALEHAVELIDIIKDTTMDDPAKIETARQLLFCRASVPEPPPSHLLPLPPSVEPSSPFKPATPAKPWPLPQ